MRHMRSRRILAMLLALSMIFGLLTTTALADNEVDQNTSNVEESAANGTSAGGSGVGQSSGASEDESSKVTNNEDVPTEEETTPEEKKTTSSEEVDTQEGVGENPVEETTYVASIGEQGYASLDAAIQAATEGATITLAENASVYLTSGIAHEGNKSRTVTIQGDGTQTIDIATYAVEAEGATHLNYQRGSKLTFNNVKIVSGEDTYDGIVCSELAYNDCTITGVTTLYGAASFMGCTFENTMENQYSIWTWGGTDVEIDGCTFNTNGKAILLYGRATEENPTNLTVSGTTFNDRTNGAAGKAAIEIGNDYNATYTLNVTNSTVESGFADGKNTGSKLWANKNSMAAENLTVEKDGELLYGKKETTGVATVGGETFDTLEKAFAVLSNKAYTLTLNDESAWDATTPVYWAAGEQKGYEATLAAALTAAYRANAGDITIICRPGADVGTMTHGHVADNLTIYGNDAYISGGECELEVDTFKFDRNTGKQATDGVTLDKDITITAYELDNLGVWGQRNTGYTVNVNLTDCDTVHGITVQRVYISGETGVNNITLTGCDFGTTATSVYSNADGEINITNCSFTGAQVPVNFNHKTDGEQTVTVSNSTFTSCGDDGKWATFAAPVRFVNSGSGKQSATVDTCTFADTVGSNGDILIGDGRPGQKSNDVNLTVTDTEANIQAQQPGYYNGNETDTSKLGTATSPASGTLTTSVKTLISGGETSDAIVDEKTLRKALFDAPTDGRQITIKLENDITLDMLYAAENFDEEKLDDNATGDTFNRYKLGVHPTEDDPDHWNPLVTNQSQEARLLYGAYYHMSATDERIARLVVKDGQNIVLDLNGHTIQKDPRATHGDWSNTCTDILANYGTLTITDTSTGTKGTIKGNGYISCQGAVLHNYAGATMNVGAINVDGNAEGMSQGTGQYVVANEGGTLSIDGANIFDTATSASLLVNTTGTMSVKNATLSHPATKTFNVKGGTVEINEGVEITSDTYAIFVKGGTVKLNANVSIKASSEATTPGTLAIEGETATVEKAESVEMEAPAGYKWENNVLVKAPEAKKVAKVGETEYATLEAAVAAVDGTNNTITLLTDVIQNTQLSIDKSLTLDLAGHKIYNTKDIWGDTTYCLLRVEDNAVVTITGNGTVAAKKDDCYAISITSGSLTIENGTFIGNISAVQVETGSLTIKDGTFKQIQESKYGNTYVINCIDDEFASGAATVAIYGGTFVDFDPNVSPEKKVDGVTPSFAAPGVGITKNADGTFSAASGMTAQLLDANDNSVKAYKTLAEAFTEASEGQTVRLLTNATENVTIADNKNLTLDLNGHTINGGTGTAVATIKNCGTVTITDSSAAKTGTIKRDDQGVKDEKSYYVIRNIGTMTIEQAIVTNNSGYAKPNPSGSMVGSSLICNGDDDLGGTLNISGGTFEQQNFLVIKNGALGTLNVTGGTFTSKHSAIQNWFKANITGGEIKGQLWTDSWKVDESVGETTIGGNATFTGEIVMDIYGNVPPTLEITGGKLDVTNWRVTPAAAKAGAKPAVSGGTFSSAVVPEYCAEGFEPKDNGDGTFGVKEISAAKIGNIEYETLVAAFAEAKDGDTIVLLKDSSGDGIVVKQSTFTDKGLIVDFNNHSYTVGGVLVGSSGTASNGFQLNKDNKITFKNGALYGDASVAGDETTNWTGAPAILIQNYCDLTLQSMTISGGDETVYTMSNNHGNVVIKDTTINAGKAQGYSYGPYAFDVCGYSTYTGVSVSVENSTINGNIEISKSNGNTYDATLTLGSGTKVNGSISDGGNGDKVTVTKDTSVNVAAPDGYKWVDGENGQTLAKIVMVAEVNGKQYETLQAAIDAASKNQTVKLLNNTKENVTIAKALTLDLNGKTLNGGQVKGTPALKVDNASVTIQDSSAAQTGTIMREDTAENSGKTSHYVIDVQGKYGFLKIEGGNIKNNSGVVGTSGKGASLIRLGNDSVSAWPTLTIKGGTFTQNNFIAIKVDRGTLHLLGGEINSANSYAIENWNNAYIKGGTVNGTVSSWVYSTGVAFSKLEISGGTVNGNVASVNYDSAADKQARIYITGGEVTGTLGTYTYSNGLVPTTETAMATVEVTGGTFDKDPTTYVVEGSTVNKNSEGKFGVEKAYLCKIGEKQYYTMSEAFHAVQAGETITMLRDYTTNSVQNSGDDSFTIDLNGHTWTANIVDVNSAAFEINYSDVTLTVKNGKVISSQLVGLIPSAMSGTITYNSSGLVFEGVEVTANGHSGIETNGNNTNDTVTLKDSTLNVPNGFGIYFPSSGKLTIDNSKITAMTLGVQVCSGSLDIKGADTKIEVTGDPVPKTENDGAIQDGAAISIVNRTGYKGLGTITVTEGTFKAKEGNDAVKAYNWTNKETGEENFTASGNVNISGGSYSTAVPEDLCAEGFVPVTKANAAGLFEVKAVEGDAELLDADGTSKGYGYADKLALTATEGQTIKLIKNTTNGGFMLPAGVTLDLNGKTMTSSFLFATGNVIDSTDGTGKLIVGQKNVLFQKNEKYLPLYDKTEGAYRFFVYKFLMSKAPKYDGNDTIALSMKVEFTNLKAYYIIMDDSEGLHGINMGFTVSWPITGGDDQTWGIRLTASKMAQLYKYVLTEKDETWLTRRTFDLNIRGLSQLEAKSIDSMADLICAAWPSGVNCTTDKVTTAINN